VSAKQIVRGPRLPHSVSVRAWVTRAALIAVVASSAFPSLANAQAADEQTYDLGDGVTFQIGEGVRTSVSAVSPFAPSQGYAQGGNGESTIARYNLDDLRTYFNLSLNQYVKVTVDTERPTNPLGAGGGAADGPAQILDAYVQFEPMNEVNVWIGQMLPPSDRSNLDGPFYLSEWYFPFVSQYPNRFFGRDLGGTVWGKLFDKKIVYSVGIYGGHNWQFLTSDQNEDPLFAGRVAFNFWNPEPAPAYYTGSTYYGKAGDILTIGIVGMFQHNGVGTFLKRGDYAAGNVDALLEKKFGDYGVIDLEGAFYDYNTDGIVDVPPTFNYAGTTAMVGGITQGTAYLLSAEYLIPYDVGPGKFQPYVRWQEFTATISNTASRQFDAGLNYVIKGPDLRISFDYARDTGSLTPTGNRWTIGLQVQI
jgi:hypothetical protein